MLLPALPSQPFFAADVALKGRGCFEGVDRIEGTGLL